MVLSPAGRAFWRFDGVSGGGRRSRYMLVASGGHGVMGRFVRKRSHWLVFEVGHRGGRGLLASSFSVKYSYSNEYMHSK